MAKTDRNRQKSLQSFLELCEAVEFPVEPFQKKVAGALLGPEREKLITLPRKNGKSRLIGTFAAWHLLNTDGAQAYIAANSEEQARIVFEYSRAVALHPAVDEEFEVRYRELRRPDGGFLRVRAADPAKLLGLTPTLAVLDEYCAAKDDKVYVALRSALLPGATMFTITTAGVGAESPLGRLRARALGQPDVRTRGALSDARGENIRMLEWSVDPDISIANTRAAKRANPLSLITPEWLREQREALHELDFRRFHLNQWTSKIGSWLPAGAFQKCVAEYEIEPGERIWAGIDVGGSRADSAVCWVTEDLRVGCAIFEGEDAILDVRDLVPELAERYDLAAVACDPWRTGQMMREWEERGGFKVLEFPQHDGRMIPASERLHDAIVNGELRHPDNPDLNRHVAAAVAKHGRRGWRLDKAERSENIDACIALAIALDLASRHKPPTPPQIVWA